MADPILTPTFGCRSCQSEDPQGYLHLEHHREVSTTYPEFAVKDVLPSQHDGTHVEVVVRPYTANSEDEESGSLWHLVCSTHGRLRGIQVVPNND